MDAKDLLARSAPKQFEQVGKMRVIKPNTRKLQHHSRIHRPPTINNDVYNNNNNNNMVSVPSIHHHQIN